MTITGVGIQIGNFLLPYYGLMVLLGICAGVILGLLQCRRFRLPFDDFVIIVCTGVFFGLLGAKVLYLVVSWNNIDSSRLLEWRYVMRLLESGFVFYGGLIGAAAGLAICRWGMHLEVKDVLRTCIPCLPLAHGFGRIGCSLVGCCYGVEHQSFPRITYSSSWFAPNGVGLFPVQPIEALCLFLLAGALVLAIDRYRCTHGISIYLVAYACIRFVLEFWRGDAARGFLGPLSTSQWISLAVLALGILLACTWERRLGPLPDAGGHRQEDA